MSLSDKVYEFLDGVDDYIPKGGRVVVQIVEDCPCVSDGMRRTADTQTKCALCGGRRVLIDAKTYFSKR